MEEKVNNLLDQDQISLIWILVMIRLVILIRILIN
jgi:hypothetical protein